MRSPVHLPELNCPDPRLSLWFARVGDRLLAGDRLVEVLVDGATVDITAPVTGRLVERHAYPDEPLHAGQLLGVLETDGDAGRP